MIPASFSDGPHSRHPQHPPRLILAHRSTSSPLCSTERPTTTAVVAAHGGETETERERDKERETTTLPSSAAMAAVVQPRFGSIRV
ncbi:hypothetical protein Hdeb2414_s0405g00887011 [Helianthus debilis subsp. tardiflorus]